MRKEGSTAAPESHTSLTNGSKYSTETHEILDAEFKGVIFFLKIRRCQGNKEKKWIKESNAKYEQEVQQRDVGRKPRNLKKLSKLTWKTQLLPIAKGG